MSNRKFIKPAQDVKSNSSLLQRQNSKTTS